MRVCMYVRDLHVVTCVDVGCLLFTVVARVPVRMYVLCSSLCTYLEYTCVRCACRFECNIRDYRNLGLLVVDIRLVVFTCSCVCRGCVRHAYDALYIHICIYIYIYIRERVLMIRVCFCAGHERPCFRSFIVSRLVRLWFSACREETYENHQPP